MKKQRAVDLLDDFGDILDGLEMGSAPIVADALEFQNEDGEPAEYYTLHITPYMARALSEALSMGADAIVGRMIR